MAPTRREVVRVVGGGDLDGTRAEAALHDVVGDDGHDALDEGDEDPPADEGPGALVLGMDGGGRVAQGRRGGGSGPSTGSPSPGWRSSPGRRCWCDRSGTS